MQYRRISADCHLDLPWLPPELFVSEAKRALRERIVGACDCGNFYQFILYLSLIIYFFYHSIYTKLQIMLLKMTFIYYWMG